MCVSVAYLAVTASVWTNTREREVELLKDLAATVSASCELKGVYSIRKTDPLMKGSLTCQGSFSVRDDLLQVQTICRT